MCNEELFILYDLAQMGKSWVKLHKDSWCFKCAKRTGHMRADWRSALNRLSIQRAFGRGSSGISFLSYKMMKTHGPHGCSYWIKHATYRIDPLVIFGIIPSFSTGWVVQVGLYIRYQGIQTYCWSYIQTIYWLRDHPSTILRLRSKSWISIMNITYILNRECNNQ